MKIRLVTICLLSFFLLALSSCQAIGDIFKTGVWFGVIGVVAFIALIIYFVTRSRR
ncbi:MAG: hypothetical protein ABJB86_23345 [Bacteroidota bacterium]